MFVNSSVDKTTKSTLYADLLQQVSHLIEGEENELANLANVSALLYMHLDKVNWAGFYLWYPSEQQLILGPFQGKPACIRIQPGKGVCGIAAKERKPLVVPDVFAFPGHITCDPDSRSEVVVPLVKDNVLFGVLDMDSPEPNQFDDEDAKALGILVDKLMNGTKFQKR